MRTLQAINSNVAIRMNTRKEMTEGGLALPPMAIKPEAEGTVVSVGKGVQHVKCGDVVGYPNHLGTRFEVGGEDWLVIDECKVLYVRE